jgi:uncharacterized protein (UPF0147 family)
MIATIPAAHLVLYAATLTMAEIMVDTDVPANARTAVSSAGRVLTKRKKTVKKKNKKKSKTYNF